MTKTSHGDCHEIFNESGYNYCRTIVSFICYFIVGVSGDYFVNLTSSGKFLLPVYVVRDVHANTYRIFVA